MGGAERVRARSQTASQPIGDIVMLARADLDVDDVAPSVLEGGDRGVAALERVKSVAAAGDWANIRFILSEDVANIPLPNI